MIFLIVGFTYIVDPDCSTLRQLGLTQTWLTCRTDTSLHSCLSSCGCQTAGLSLGSGFAFKKRKAARSARDPNTHVADGVPILPGLSRFEMTPTIDLEAVATSGKSKHTKSSQTSSIVSAFKRRKEVRNVKEHEALAPAGAKVHLGHNISAMTPTTDLGVAVMLGRSSLNLHLPTAFQRVECASKKLRAALNAKVTAKAVVDGAKRRIPSGLCHSEMILTTEEEAVLITGIWIVTELSKCGEALNCPRDRPC